MEGRARDEPVISVSREAAEWLKQRYGAEHLRGAYIRVVFHVRDGLPAHGLVPERQKRVSDRVVEESGVSFIVGVDSVELVAGSRIELDEEADEVVILNPNIDVRDES
jgi:Fe-S cluster assembly iron-binding protein IscA